MIDKQKLLEYFNEKIEWYKKTDFFHVEIATIEQIIEKVEYGTFDIKEKPTC